MKVSEVRYSNEELIEALKAYNNDYFTNLTATNQLLTTIAVCNSNSSITLI